MTEPDKPTPSLYEWAGGEPAMRRLMDCFYDCVERDEPARPALLARRGERGPPRARHRLVVGGARRSRFASLLSLAADDAGLPDDPEFRSALVAYAEWGSRLAMHNSQPGAEVFEHAPVPRWGWGEAPPFQP